MSPAAAADLFARLTGRNPESEQESAVSELVRLCGYLPLAIALLAARLRPEPRWEVETLVNELVTTRDRLTYLRAEDIQVEAAFQLSYQCLPPARRRFFRRLGLSPGTDIDVYAAAALGGVGLPTARRHLDSLYDDHPLDQPVQGRYRMHDLLGAFARRLVTGEPAWQRNQAVGRLLDYYEQAAATADRHFAPRPHSAAGRRPKSQIALPVLADGTQAAAWMDAELPNLLACATYAMSNGDDGRLISMSAALAEFLRRAGPYRQSISLHQAAADAAQRLDNRAARATALYNVGVLLRRAGEYPAASAVLSKARDLYGDLGDRLGEANVLIVAGIVQRLAGDYRVATEMLGEALSRFRELGETTRQAEVLSQLAVIRWLTEEFPTALQLLDRALVLQRHAGNRVGQAEVLVHQAMTRHLLHDYPPAIRALEQAIALFRNLGSQVGLANAKFMRAVMYRLTGDRLGATQFLDESLRIYCGVGDRIGQANALTELGILRRLAGDHRGATECLGESLALYQTLGNRRGQASALQELGLVWRLAGDPVRALEDLTRAIDIYRDIGSRIGQAEVLNCLGTLLLGDGDPQAHDRFDAALRLAREVGNPLEEARALDGIAGCHVRHGNTTAAARQLRAALAIYQRIGAPDQERIKAELLSLNTRL